MPKERADCKSPRREFHIWGPTTKKALPLTAALLALIKGIHQEWSPLKTLGDKPAFGYSGPKSLRAWKIKISILNQTLKLTSCQCSHWKMLQQNRIAKLQAIAFCTSSSSWTILKCRQSLARCPLVSRCADTTGLILLWQKPPPTENGARVSRYQV